jgi:hypothetical protein
MRFIAELYSGMRMVCHCYLLRGAPRGENVIQHERSSLAMVYPDGRARAQAHQHAGMRTDGFRFSQNAVATTPLTSSVASLIRLGCSCSKLGDCIA